MRTTQRKGDIAVAQAVATFTKLGCDVSIPFTESAAYDLVVDDGQALRRVQCKYCGEARSQVDLRQIHSNSTGYIVRLVPEGAIRLALRAGSRRIGVPDKGMPERTPFCNAASGLPTSSGGRVRLTLSWAHRRSPSRVMTRLDRLSPLAPRTSAR